MSAEIFDRRIVLRVKRKVYKMPVRVALTRIYEMEVAELKMLRFSLGVTKSLEGPMSSCHSKVLIVPPKFTRTAASLTIFSHTTKTYHLVSICHTLQYNVNYEEM